MFQFEEQGGDAKAIGWISMADMFMLCSIVMLAVAVCFALSLRKTDELLSTSTDQFAKLRNINSLTIEELKANVAQLRTESGDHRARANSLVQQLEGLKIQLADSEKQVAHYKSETSKYKSQGEALAGDLSIQTAKLVSVQSEFDKYKNINSLSISELKTEVLRLTKLSDDYKLSIASLNAQISGLEGKLSGSNSLVASLRLEREQFKTESERLAAALAKQRTQFDSDLAKANADLAKLNSALVKASGDREQLLADLAASKAGYAALQKDANDTKITMNIVDADKKRLEAKLAELEGTIVGLTSEIGVLQPQIAKLKVDLTGAKLRIIDLEKAVFETINRAKLVITISAQDIPKDFTLELFVTDPLANECGPFSPVIFNDGDEIGFLQQSVDFKSGREGSQRAVFYSLRPVQARNSPGIYTVKAMLRHNGNDENVPLPSNVTVACNIDLPNVSNTEAHRFAKREINTRGYIKKVRRNAPLNANSQYKNMWPWEPVYHFERILCDFKIDGDRITSLRTYENLNAETPTAGNTVPLPSGGQEQRIESIRNRTGN